jgi:hypothetical protein
MSELEIRNGGKYLIVAFGGMALKMGGIAPFEFVHFLSEHFKDCDLLFYVDKEQCCYHKGIEGISTNIEGTVSYLKEKIMAGNYHKVLFMGTSGGGYASILFGSLCNIENVLAFIPATRLKHPKYEVYRNLKQVINPNTHYLLYGDLSVTDSQNCHHISHCEDLEVFANVKVVKLPRLSLTKLRDTGVIQESINAILYTD